MATEGRRFETPIAAGEDLNTSAFQYHAIALDDGKLANNAEEASGVLLNKPKSGEGLSLGYFGELKFAAGGAISKGAKITVTTSGWFTSAGSSSVIVGECKAAVTSGSIGTGIFSFPTANAAQPQTYDAIDVTAVATLIAGVAVSIVTKNVVANPTTAHAIIQAAVSSGSSGVGALHGKCQGRMDPAACCSLGDAISTTTSGYFAIAGSGYTGNAIALQNIGSNSVGSIYFWGNVYRAIV